MDAGERFEILDLANVTNVTNVTNDTRLADIMIVGPCSNQRDARVVNEGLSGRRTGRRKGVRPA